MKARERNCGIELLRILSMYMIVMLHVMGHGGLQSEVESNAPGGGVLDILVSQSDLFVRSELLCVD